MEELRINEFTLHDSFNDLAHYWEGDEGVKVYTADFETTTDIEDCRVWAFAICDVDNPDNVTYGNTIEGFFTLMQNLPNCKVYFHNLAFDVSFMFDYLLKNGYAWENDRFPRYDKGFTTVISDMNQVYSLRVNFGHGHTVTFWDSYKIIPLSIRQEAKAFSLEEGKGDLDYKAYRGVGHVLTEKEKDYIRRDVQIDARALAFMVGRGLNRMTIGACALADYKAGIGGDKSFRHHFPLLTADEDAFIRRAYKGGFTYANPRYAGIEMGEGISFDVNSLYPSVMAASDGQVLPYGKPKWFYGEPPIDDLYTLWIAKVKLYFKIRVGRIPCIQLKGNMSFTPTEYILDSRGEVTITVTSVDWELICAQYDVQVMEWLGGYRFKASTELFKGYVGKWAQVKNDATLSGNSGMRTIAKLMLNSLYGKFSTQLTVRSRKPVLVDGVVRYVDIAPYEREGVYLPVGCFITAYARYKTITTAQACGDRFLYSDTDSVKVLGTEPLPIDVDPVRLGAWKDEGHFNRFKALRAKTYIADYSRDLNKRLEVHVAGLPAKCHRQVTFDNFHLGATYEGKLYQKRVEGGIVLVEDTFTISGGVKDGDDSHVHG